uniref:1-phosphatidylinositol-5-phosphate 4-kinase n=2 Tax=Macrostomum lignano TaxID=282301 RepID=A0A1I8JK46_9PLAT
ACASTPFKFHLEAGQPKGQLRRPFGPAFRVQNKWKPRCPSSLAESAIAPGRIRRLSGSRAQRLAQQQVEWGKQQVQGGHANHCEVSSVCLLTENESSRHAGVAQRVNAAIGSRMPRVHQIAKQWKQRGVYGAQRQANSEVRQQQVVDCPGRRNLKAQGLLTQLPLLGSHSLLNPDGDGTLQQRDSSLLEEYAQSCYEDVAVAQQSGERLPLAPFHLRNGRKEAHFVVFVGDVQQFADVVDHGKTAGCALAVYPAAGSCAQDAGISCGLLVEAGCSSRMEISLVEVPGPHEMDIHVKKSRKVKGVRQKLKLFRANEPLKSVIMWGISYSFEQLNHVNKRTMLLPDDFKSYLKVKVDNHLFNKDNMPSRFQFKEYCPLVFADLRAKFGVADSADLLSSWTKRQPHWDSSLGRADARFLCTQNRRYVLRLITCEEVEQVHQVLQAYHGYIVECSAATLLPQYLAMYRATVEDTDYYLLMMRCVFNPRYKIHRKYDLKGSTIDREASEKERSKELPTYKDVDFVTARECIEVGPAEKARLMSTLRADVDFLQRENLMDYSLLVGVHDRSRLGEDEAVDGAPCDLDEAGEADADGADSEAEEAAAAAAGATVSAGDDDDEEEAALVAPSEESFAVTSASGQCVYFISIISILTKYGVRKRTAQTYKSMKHGSSSENQLSTVRPEVYARRFLEFIEASMQ